MYLEPKNKNKQKSRENDLPWSSSQKWFARTKKAKNKQKVNIKKKKGAEQNESVSEDG